MSARVGANIVVESHGATLIGQSAPSYFQPEVMKVMHSVGDCS